MQLIESSWKPANHQGDLNAPPAPKDTLSGSDDQATNNEGHDYFMAKVSCLTNKVLYAVLSFFSKYVL